VSLSTHPAPASHSLKASRPQADTEGTRSSQSPGWLAPPRELAHPLRSILITRTSSLLRDGPSLCPASVLLPSWVLHLSFSLNIETTGSHVSHKSLDQVRTTFMPGAAQAVNRLPLDSSWKLERPPVLTPSSCFRHLISGSLTLTSLILTCHDPQP